MDPAEEKTSKAVDIYRDTWVRFLGMWLYTFNIELSLYEPEQTAVCDPGAER